MRKLDIVKVAKKECSFNDKSGIKGMCWGTGKPCHVDKKRCEEFEAWVAPLGKYKKEIKYYLEKVVQ